MSDPRARLVSSARSVDSAVPRVVHFLRVARNASSLESSPRKSVPHKQRSAPLVRLCSARQRPAIVHSSALDHRVCASARNSVWECVRHSLPQLSPLRMACVPRGQWAPLDADMFELIDCLVEPVLVGRAILLLPVLAQTCTKHVQCRVWSLLADIPIATP